MNDDAAMRDLSTRLVEGFQEVLVGVLSEARGDQALPPGDYYSVVANALSLTLATAIRTLERQGYIPQGGDERLIADWTKLLRHHLAFVRRSTAKD